ncbi:MAG: abortive infection family protein [bacterium]
MTGPLISRSVLTDLREHFVREHVLRTIDDAFRNQGIERRPREAASVPGERRQLVEEYYASLDLTRVSDVQKLLHIIQREIAFCQPKMDDLTASSIGKVIIGLEQAGYRLDGDKILPTANTPLISLQDHLQAISSQSIMADWSRMLTAAETDPADAITSARAVVESTCKSILEKLEIPYEDSWSLGRLYKETAQALELSPAGYREEVFKQILGGMFSVTHGLAAVRNAFGDAHGKGRRPVRATPRHARLAVNAAGTLAVFLLETLEARDSSDREA